MTVRETFGTVFDGNTSESHVSCLSAEDVVGGGVDFSAFNLAGLSVVETAPWIGESWHATVRNESGTSSASYSVYAMCQERP